MPIIIVGALKCWTYYSVNADMEDFCSSTDHLSTEVIASGPHFNFKYIHLRRWPLVGFPGASHRQGLWQRSGFWMVPVNFTAWIIFTWRKSLKKTA